MPREIQAVSADVLGNHDELLDAVSGQGSGLVEHVVQLPAAVAAAEGGDDAVGAVVVTALGDLQVGIIVGAGEHPGRLVQRRVDVAKGLDGLPGQGLLHGGDDLAVAARTQNAVHLGHLGEDLVLIPLGEAAGDQDLTQLPCGLQLSPGRECGRWPQPWHSR